MTTRRCSVALVLVAASIAGCVAARPAPNAGAASAVAAAPAAALPAAPDAAPQPPTQGAFVPPPWVRPAPAETQPQADGARAAIQERRTWIFDADPFAMVPVVEFDNRFAGARLNDCTRLGPRDFRLVISPENEPINPSPWYAFRVLAHGEAELKLHLVITSSKARPRARTSPDGVRWTRVPDDRWSGGEGARECVLALRAGPSAMWVASGPMVGNESIDAWADALAAHGGAEVAEVGRSMAGRPIRMFAFHPGAPEDWVVVIGRQHPPEVAGTLGMMRFMEAVVGPSDVAARFRARFRVALVPVVNPDGVHEGHWRSSLAAVDPNRDWGPFALPETRAVRDAIEGLAARPGARIRLLLDFHATSKDVFYLPPAGARIEPAGFPEEWMEAIARRFPGDTVERTGSHNANEWTFKRWAFERFAAPGITWEIGSGTPHDRIARFVPGAAEEAMRILLERIPHASGAPAPGRLRLRKRPAAGRRGSAVRAGHFASARSIASRRPLSPLGPKPTSMVSILPSFPITTRVGMPEMP